MENEITMKHWIIGSIISSVIITGLRYLPNYISEQNDRTETNRYVLPSMLKVEVTDLNGDGKKETLAKYNGNAYFFKVGTDGIPFFEPIKGLESKVEK